MNDYFYVALFGSLAMNLVLAYVMLRIALNPDRSPWQR